MANLTPFVLCIKLPWQHRSSFTQDLGLVVPTIVERIGARGNATCFIKLKFYLENLGEQLGERVDMFFDKSFFINSLGLNF